MAKSKSQKSQIQQDELSGDSRQFESNVEEKQEMTLEESRAYRASLYKPMPIVLSEEEKREQFRIFWAKEKAKYGERKELEKGIWLHLKSAKMDSPEQFEAGLAHFGFKKIRK